MIVKPTVSELLKKVGDNRYSLVIMTAKRARQIANGDQVKTKVKARKQNKILSSLQNLFQ